MGKPKPLVRLPLDGVSIFGLYILEYFFFIFFISNEIKCIDSLLKYKSIRYQPQGETCKPRFADGAASRKSRY